MVSFGTTYGGEVFALVAISAGSALLSEFISWVWVYRTEQYKSLKGSLERAERKLEAVKAGGGGGGKKDKKKEKNAEAVLSEQHRQLGTLKYKTGFVTGILMLALYQLVTRTYKGIVVAQLPFEPFNMMQKLTHRGIDGSNMQDCSMAFIYVLCSMAVRGNVIKLLGFGPSRAMARVQHPWIKSLQEEGKKIQ